MLRTGVLALQKSFDVAGDKLAVNCAALVVYIFFSRRNAVPSRMFRDIHASVSYPDDILRRKPVNWVAGDTETTSNVVLAQHGIGCKPEAQAFGQNLCLLCSGFWH